MRLNIGFITLALAAALSACAPTPPHYAAARHIELYKALPLPPAPGSAADRRDLAAVLEAQENRTEEQAEEAKLDAKLDVFRFQPALGENFTPENLPLTMAFFKQVKHDESAVIDAAKKHYARPRPYVASEDVHPVVPRPHNDSYPSGHATFAYVNGLLLAKMLPEKKAAIMERAAHFAHNRVVGGVHYPTDVAAGTKAGYVIVKALLKDPEFRKDFEKAKTELRSVVLD